MRAALLAALLLSACGGDDDDDDDAGLADGAPCTVPAECASGRCLALEGGLRCGRPCEPTDGCPAGEACGVELVDGEPAGLCLPAGPGGGGAACADGSDCAGRLCAAHLCLEPCTDACAQGCATAQVPVGEQEVERSVCPPPPPAPDLVLGPLPTGADGQSDVATFDVPAGVSSFTLTVVDAEGLRVAASSLVAPDGTVIADADGDPAGLQRVYNYIGVASTLVPATDDARARVQAGTYGLRVGTYDPAVFDSLVPVAGAVERVEIVFAREGTQGGLLDLELHWAPGLGVPAADAAANPYVTDLLAQMQALLAQSRVRLGNVTHHDLTADADVVEDGNEARALCSTVTAPGPHHRAVNVMIVGDLTFTGGFSGGIPGPTGLYGTNGSGIVAEALGSGHDTGILLAHEVGHFLGLRHTTEIGGGYDDVSDTPECPEGTEISRCSDYSNLMFPIFPLWDGLALTAGQVSVLSGSPMLFEARADAACPAAPWVDDLTDTAWAAGDTARLPSSFEGTCGGAGVPEAAHLLRIVRTDLTAAAVHVTASGFAPTVHIRRGADCTDASAEIACVTGTADQELVVPIEPPAPGPYFVFVDGGPGGPYVIAVGES